jgi:hypothetical protein
MRALKATYDQARQGREVAESLTPLLALLEPQPGAGSPLDEVMDLLQAILAAQEKTLNAIEALADRVGTATPR